MFSRTTGRPDSRRRGLLMRAPDLAEAGGALLDAIASAPAVRALAGLLDKPGARVACVGAAGSSSSFVAAAVARLTGRPVLLILAHPDDADEAADELAAQGVRAERFPALELTPGESHLSLDLFAERLRIARGVASAPPEVLAAPIHALMQRLPAQRDAARAVRTITTGDRLDPADLVRWLDEAGYRRADAVEDAGEFAVRGGIVDVFPPASARGEPTPVRLDFFGDEVESIHEIDPATMASDRAVESVELVRADPAQTGADTGPTLMRALGGRWIAVVHEPIEVTEQARGYYERVIDASGVVSPPETLRGVREDLGGFAEISQYAAPAAGLGARVDLPASNLPPIGAETDEAMRDLADLAARARVVVACQNDAEADRLGELLGVHAASAGIDTAVGYVHRGFIWDGGGSPQRRSGRRDGEVGGENGESVSDNKLCAISQSQDSSLRLLRLCGESPLAVVPHHELFHRFLTRRKPSRLRGGRSLEAFIELEPGDLAVHADHGLCRFIGLTVMRRAGAHGRDARATDMSHGRDARATDMSHGRDARATGEQEFLTLEFSRMATMYVPVSQIDKVQRYIGGFRGKPPLSTIGSKRWRAQKEGVADAVHDLAAELLRVQAARAATPGVRYPADTDWQREFEAEFPYDETEDQIAALADIKRDMQAPRPMDRLLCGDVGFGKTELAIRAAFKAVEFGKQVAVLVPTTVLAEQHERTFRDRFADYPFRVESLSRFKTAAEQRAVLKEVAAGRVDLVIGTHRLLSKDVSFKDLGLVIVDEEQRFGVEHKQRLLSLRVTVDVLTLSATPIPRTLHLSLLGLRDISSLATAPSDRRSVVTDVIPYNRERIRRALARELARGGQAYVVHNRVKSIHRMADEIRSLAPGAQILVGHGQMPAHELERVMLDFVRRRADILVCTTIIESGVDIPSANTMIITDADRFGLADLHQLRGRVGRYKHRAYCLLLLPETRVVTDVAKRRLQAIEEFSMLGAGFKIAMRDLEIRGAGNILGPEQSGHIAAVGYEMYCRLLEEAVRRLKNEPATATPAETVIEIGLTGLIPAAYIPSVKRRIEAYRRLAQAKSPDEIERVERDLAGAYGALPAAAKRLVRLAEIRALAASAGIDAIVIDGSDVVLRGDDVRAIAARFHGAAGTTRVVTPPRPGARADVYYRPPAAYLEPESLANILRGRLQRETTSVPSV